LAFLLILNPSPNLNPPYSYIHAIHLNKLAAFWLSMIDQVKSEPRYPVWGYYVVNYDIVTGKKYIVTGIVFIIIQ
jgi:hypothetical protein